jgi:hypothetical protein
MTPDDVCSCLMNCYLPKRRIRRLLTQVDVTPSAAVKREIWIDHRDKQKVNQIDLFPAVAAAMAHSPVVWHDD